MRTFVSHLALLLEDEEQEIIDIRLTALLSPFMKRYFSGMELSSPFFETYPSFLTVKEGFSNPSVSL